MIFVGQGQMLSVLFFSVVDQGPRNANEKISETVNRVVSKTVNVSLIYRFLHRFQVKKHVIVLPSKLLSLKLRVIYLMELAFKTRSLKDRKLELN